MMRHAVILCLVLGWAAVAASVRGAGAPAKPTFSRADIAFFEKQVRPLLAARCYKCHSAGAKKLRAGLRLDARSAMLRGGDTGPAVVPGKPDASLLIKAVRYTDDDLQMPPKGKLSKREVATLVEWVRRGAPFPAGEKAPAPTKRTIDLEAGKRFWSFQPLRRTPPPKVKRAGWGRNDIDAFVLAALEQRGLQPNEPAARRVLIRRVTFDLMGMPPTPDEVDAFINDKSPDAYDRLVERLLASPHYGERWARVWLDLVRYTDTTASWLNSTGQAWLYRDWVVDAFNDDMPYDQFVKRQLATDMMAETGPDDSPALGLLGLSPTYWKELRLAPDVIKVIVADEWEERIDVVSRTFLGLTVACARCHDHKFDPITMKDYYALAGVFASTKLTDRAIVAPGLANAANEARRKVKSLEEQVKKLKSRKPPPADLSEQLTKLGNQISALKKAPHYDTPLAHGVEDASLYVQPNGSDATKLAYKPGEPRDLPMFIRGSPSNPGKVVPRRFLAVLSPGEPKPFERGSGRLELAQAIVGQAAPLAARVIVNRIWLQHFGRGLVDTPSNFGAQGARPSHPALLDELAARFVEHGWSIKWLHRQIVRSAAYRQSSAFDKGRHAIDPDNRWLWRMNRRRLDIEAWRDAMLAVSGQLDRKLGGPALDLNDAANRRRTVYGRVHRRDMNAMLRLYDFPDPTAHSPQRVTTTTPLQQLFVLNSPFVRRQAIALAKRVRAAAPNDTEAQVRLAYALLFARPATDKQVALAVAFIHEARQQHGSQEVAWADYAHVLLGSNEFMFVD